MCGISWKEHQHPKVVEITLAEKKVSQEPIESACSPVFARNGFFQGFRA